MNLRLNVTNVNGFGYVISEFVNINYNRRDGITATSSKDGRLNDNDLLAKVENAAYIKVDSYEMSFGDILEMLSVLELEGIDFNERELESIVYNSNLIKKENIDQVIKRAVNHDLEAYILVELGIMSEEWLLEGDDLA